MKLETSGRFHLFSFFQSGDILCGIIENQIILDNGADSEIVERMRIIAFI